MLATNHLPDTASAGLIHSSAVVERGATIGCGVTIGPFCTVGADAVLEDGVELVSHVVVAGRTTIGAGAKLYPFCTVGVAPQDLKYDGEDTETVVGPRTVIREHCSIHRGTVTGAGVTRVGADCLLMAVVHVAHDCEIGDGVIISNNVVMGGHVSIGERAVVGGGAAILQFARIGKGAMIGGLTGVAADVIPYGFLFGNRGKLSGLNIVGLRRRGVDKTRLHQIRAAYNFIFSGPGTFAERVADAQARYGGDPCVADMLDFIARPGPHGLITTVARHGAGDEE